MSDEPLFYWDACMFFEHLCEEPVTPSKLRAVQRLLQENKDKKNRIITSVVTHIEVIPKKLNPAGDEREDKYWGYFNGRYFLDVEISANVIRLSRDIRDYYYKKGNEEKGIKPQVMSTGDAIHLATAIIYKADELHTRDGRRKGGNIPLLGLPESSPNGKIAGQWSLKIVSPEDAQPDLLDPT